MIPPFPLYVDEISPDKIKATVSNSSTVSYNIKTISLDLPFSDAGNLFNLRNGTFILPIGKFVCMLVRNNGRTGMILLDLIDKEDLAAKMAEKLDHVDLRERFMQVYDLILRHPEKHNRFKLVVGSAEMLGNWR